MRNWKKLSAGTGSFFWSFHSFSISSWTFCASFCLSSCLGSVVEGAGVAVERFRNVEDLRLGLGPSPGLLALLGLALLRGLGLGLEPAPPGRRVDPEVVIGEEGEMLAGGLADGGVLVLEAGDHVLGDGDVA